MTANTSPANFPTGLMRGKTAVVIGGTSGIGKAIALGLAQAGADTIASSRSFEPVDDVARSIEKFGVRTARLLSDVRDRGSLERLCKDVTDTFGRVDVLFNCAGITRRIPTMDCDEATWDSIMDVNLNGTLRACQIFGASMLEQGYGRIVNIASLSTFVAFHEVAAYGASKAAVGALTRSLAVEWATRGITVNAIAPGIFPTALNRALLNSPRGHELLQRTPMGRFGSVDELVGTALYLSSDLSAFMTGQILVVDGGMLASGVNQ